MNKETVSPASPVTPTTSSTALVLVEGFRAPNNAETGVSENLCVRGAGNESVVRTVGDESGGRVQGTGPTSEAAQADAEKLLKKGGRQDIGEAFGPVHKGTPNP